ncbi:hypothetical protein K435DRAFT_747229 [Dendrothele bispora CBS 962.96]|uniref:ABM domain-containing protein n=1 Tax=Dendrothele bispora (strain CBS 962.96) TaxID=1314807 RepID=A0A4S8MMC2_DENBC|nr:hypothetical protein K435DRAFT_747229 [Dendrothele bispora CBS 962.96]
MPITELVILELVSPHTFDSPLLAKALAAFTAQQSQYSAHPLTFYRDTTSSSRFYLVTGWHNEVALSLWREQVLSKHKQMDEFLVVQDRLYLDMNFDTIPNNGQGIFCVTRHTVRMDNEASEEEEGVGTVEQGGRVHWMGGGMSREQNAAWHQFIQYVEGTSEDTIRKQHRKNTVYLMRRISIPKH